MIYSHIKQLETASARDKTQCDLNAIGMPRCRLYMRVHYIEFYNVNLLRVYNIAATINLFQETIKISLDSRQIIISVTYFEIIVELKYLFKCEEVKTPLHWV